MCDQQSPAPCGQALSVRTLSRRSLARSASFAAPVASANFASASASSYAAPAQSYAVQAQSLARSPSLVQAQTVYSAPAQSYARSASFAQSRVASQRNANYTSQIEQALLNAQSPIPTNETAQTTANGQRGIFLNKQEVDSFRGSRPIASYQLHQDSNPLVIRKSSKNVEHVQQVNVRFLKPPTGQAGPIIIKQEPNRLASPAPPVIIRQQGCRARTPAPQVFREAPPKVPSLGSKVITLKGKTLPPPPRKVIIEKLPAQPAKPGKICVERWLAPEGLKRRVIFKPAPGQQQETPRNVVIEWSPIQANVRQQVNVRGVTQQNPEDYARQHGSQLVDASQLPEAARNVQAPGGARLAADAVSDGSLVQLEGDVHALALVDLEAEGLGEYRHLVGQARAASSSGCNACAPTPAPSNHCGC